MHLIACLGNPGKKYRHNRHNVGFIIGELMAAASGISLKAGRSGAIEGKGRIRDYEAVIVMPQTFMNASGTAVKKAMDYLRIEADKLVVIHDEIELPFGEFRTKFGGGHKGHNGLRSIIQETGTADFHRLRFGVGRPPVPEMAVADYVLSDFTTEEMVRVRETAASVIDTIAAILEKC